MSGLHGTYSVMRHYMAIHPIRRDPAIAAQTAAE